MEPVSTTLAVIAAHKAFHKAHPHICSFLHKVTTRAGGYAAKSLAQNLSELSNNSNRHKFH